MFISGYPERCLWCGHPGLAPIWEQADRQERCLVGLVRCLRCGEQTGYTRRDQERGQSERRSQASRTSQLIEVK
jgi:hypothetical protein